MVRWILRLVRRIGVRLANWGGESESPATPFLAPDSAENDNIDMPKDIFRRCKESLDAQSKG